MSSIGVQQEQIEHVAGAGDEGQQQERRFRYFGARSNTTTTSSAYTAVSLTTSPMVSVSLYTGIAASTGGGVDSQHRVDIDDVGIAVTERPPAGI